jgi:hypothetical protein
MLLSTWLSIVALWRPAFPQQRSWRRAVAQALALLTVFGRRTLSRAIWAQGRHQQDWSADYRLHARSSWNPDQLFQAVLERALPLCPGAFIAVAVDDTRLRKTGRRIRSAFFQRDPLSPKFRFNLMWGLRFLQASLLVPLYRQQAAAARALPLRFRECPAAKKPRRKAPAEQWEAWRELVRHNNLSRRTVELIAGLRASFDRAGAHLRTLLIVGDNTFCNRTLFASRCPRTHLLVRARRDIKLCRRAAPNGRRFYDLVKFTPEQVRHDPALPWSTARIFHGQRWRGVRFKQIIDVYWESGARRRPLRLLVIAPIPYHVPGRGRPHYHDAAVLLTTEMSAAATVLLQFYFDRWEIEVNHREEKDTLGVGQAQLRSASAVPRQPAFVVAAYSALLLAGLLAYGPARADCYMVLPKWRRRAHRPSCLDLITQLRREMADHPHLLTSLGFKITWETLGLCAAA